MKRLYDQARTLTPFTRWLIVFAVFNVFALNAALEFIRVQGWMERDGTTEILARREGVLPHFWRFLLMRTVEPDSWRPMTEAWRYLQTSPPDSVYDHVWQQQLLKFQYPLSSLFPVEVLHVFFPGDVIHWAPLNLASWLASWGAAFLAALIFRDACRRHLRPSLLSGASRFDEWVRMGLVVLLSVTFFPIVRAVGEGQIQPWIDFAFAAMVWLYTKRQPLVAGLLAGLICLIKPQLALLAVWAGLRGEWRFVGALVAVAGVGAGAAVAMYGLEQNLNYVSFLSDLSRRGEAYYTNQSVNGIVNRLLYNGDNAGGGPASFPPFRWPVYVSTMISSALILGFAMFWRRKEYVAAPELDLMIAALSITMASPIAWHHHYGILVPMYAALLPAMLRWPVFGGGSVALLGVSYVLSSNLFHFTRYFADTPFTTLQSYLFFAALFVLAALYLLRHEQARESEESRETAAPRASPQQVRRPPTVGVAAGEAG